MQEKVCEKYDITREELQKAVDRYSAIATPKFAGNINCLLAILELLTSGDIPEKKV